MKCKVCGDVLSTEEKKIHFAKYSAVTMEEFLSTQDFSNALKVVKHGYDVNFRLSRGFTVLHYLALKFDEALFCEVVKKNPDFGCVNNENQSPAVML